ncbi:MAG: hypothetical protein ACRDIV_04560 [Ktedonobacteraceae bacterium]
MQRFSLDSNFTLISFLRRPSSFFAVVSELFESRCVEQGDRQGRLYYEWVWQDVSWS